MAARKTKLFLTLSIFYYYYYYFITKAAAAATSNSSVDDGMKQVIPCVFVFGDSLYDNGMLITRAKVDYPPYGIDYPTGRFCNGKIVPDFLVLTKVKLQLIQTLISTYEVEFLGFDKHIPPFATAKGADILKGVNYASGGGGILDETGGDVGGRISFNGQLINHGITIAKMEVLYRNVNATLDHLNKCLYLVNMGSNDYLNNYLLPQKFKSSPSYATQKFAAKLINQYRRQLKTLYNYGARKVAVFGLGLIAEIPEIRSFLNNSSSSIDSTNKVIQQFNNGLKPLIDDFNAGLDGAQFILINYTNIAPANPSIPGVKVVDASCCATSLESLGLCEDGKEPCINRNEYYFWDNFHPSEIANHAMATRTYNAASPFDAYPTDIRNLVRK